MLIFFFWQKLINTGFFQSSIARQKKWKMRISNEQVALSHLQSRKMTNANSDELVRILY